MGGREPLNFQLTPKKIVDMKIDGLPPPNLGGKGFFYLVANNKLF